MIKSFKYPPKLHSRYNRLASIPTTTFCKTNKDILLLVYPSISENHTQRGADSYI